MNFERRQAVVEFRRMLKWIVLVAVLTVIVALVYLSLTGDVTFTMVVATTLGVFLSVLLGSGLFAAAFFSDKSGIDQEVADLTRPDPDNK
jgi:glucan phosphoethanolaminetransferase (alkaline phosphatase superfamily)